MFNKVNGAQICSDGQTLDYPTEQQTEYWTILEQNAHLLFQPEIKDTIQVFLEDCGDSIL